MKSCILAVGVGVVFCLGLTSAGAQPPIVYPGGRPNPYLRPPVSPYVNLGQAGVNPALAYYGLVRPEQNFYTGMNYLTQQAYVTQQNVNNLQAGAQGMVTTGVHASFMNQSRYFMNNNALAPNLAQPATGIGTRPASVYTPPRVGGR
jgi:hypothetical protein